MIFLNIDVYKFGGTALATKKNFSLLYEILNENNNKKIIIVSAMGRSGFPYSTDSILSLANETYLNDDDFHRLISCGEIISSIVFNNYLLEKHINSYCVSYLDNGITVSNKEIKLDNNFLNEKIKMYDCLIVPGFVGKKDNGDVITLGRGNSDLSAVLMADMFSLKKVYLYKDVDGVYPFLHYPIKNVKPYSKMTSKELGLLLKYGAKVVSIDALEYAIKKGINLFIKPFLNNSTGTYIEINDNIEKDFIGFLVENKTFKLICKDAFYVREKMRYIFDKIHVLIKKETIEDNCYSFILKSSQNLLLKRNIIDAFFVDYFIKP